MAERSGIKQHRVRKTHHAMHDMCFSAIVQLCISTVHIWELCIGEYTHYGRVGASQQHTNLPAVAQRTALQTCAAKIMEEDAAVC